MLNEKKKNPLNVSDQLYSLHRAVSLETNSIVSSTTEMCVRESVEMFSWVLGETVYFHPP